MTETIVTKELFEELFAKIVESELCRAGFQRKGRNLLLCQDELQIALLRAGGKLQVNHGVTHILCLRHAFLRELKELVVLSKPSTVADDYPMLYNPELLEQETPQQWAVYQVDRFNPPYGCFFFGASNEEEVARRLDRLVYQIRYRWLPWALTLRPENVAEQLEKCKTDWWVARIWLEDYEQFGVLGFGEQRNRKLI